MKEGKTVKRIFAWILTLCFVFGLTGCKSNSTNKYEEAVKAAEERKEHMSDALDVAKKESDRVQQMIDDYERALEDYERSK